MPIETESSIPVRESSTMTNGWSRIVMHKNASTQPAVLQTCQESRQECLQFYQLIFGTQVFIGVPFTWADLLAHHEPAIHFNNLRDTVYMSRRLLDQGSSPESERWDFWDGFQSSSNFLNLRTFLKSVAFDVTELEEESVGDGLAVDPVDILSGFFRLQIGIKEIILAVRKRRDGAKIKGELEFLELDENEDMTKANVVLRSFNILFDRIARCCEKPINGRLAGICRDTWTVTPKLQNYGYHERRRPIVIA